MATAAAATAELPAAVVDIDLAQPVQPVPATRDGRRIRRAWLLIRLFDEPLGVVTAELPEHGLTADEVGTLATGAFGPAIEERREADAAPYLARRAEVLRDAPTITAVVCTRERPQELRRCLDSLVTQAYPRFRVLVVDNAPTSDATERIVGRYPDVGYLVEPRPGLSRARNAAVAVAPGEILAWTDDDVVADPHWLAEVARALADHPDADVVAGAILPGELDSEAQVWFEEFGGHSKGRGFTPAVFSPATAYRQHPLYPLPPFGTGANLTFRAGVIESIGGFDPALGAGTPAMGSEDTAALMRVMRAGGTVVYQPSALVWHFHRTDLDGLRRQLVGYGTGLTAAYTSLVLSDPRVLVDLIRLAPTAARDLFSGSSQRVRGLGAQFPRELLGLNRRGMLRGPLAYLRGRRRTR